MKQSLRSSLKIATLLVSTLVSPLFVLAQWSGPVNISPNATSALTNESMGSCIGVSGDTVHVVYVDRIAQNFGAVYYTRSTDIGLTWSTPAAISDLNGNAYNPAIAVNGPNVHVVWRNIDTVTNHRNSMYIHSIDGGNTWSYAMTIDTTVADWPAVAVSGNHVYVANDIVTSLSPYNTEIFFLYSTDNGSTWSAHQQITFADGRSEDEALNAQGADVYMSWNDNRVGNQMQIFFKHSGDYGMNWDNDTAVILPKDYGTMVCVDGSHVDIPCAGAPAGHYQLLLAQSGDNGTSWGNTMDLTNDTANTFFYPDMVRDGNDLHITCVEANVGALYFHSADGGTTWDTPYNLGNSGITPFIAYSGCVVHIIVPDSGRVNYFRNPTGNTGVHCVDTTLTSVLQPLESKVKVYPNPFSTNATVEISSKENAVLKIYDLVGKEVMSKNFAGTNQLTISRNEMDSGVYFYKIFYDGKTTSTGKLVVE